MTASDLRQWRTRHRWTVPQAAQAIGYTSKQFARLESQPGLLPHKVAMAVKGVDAEVASQ